MRVLIACLLAVMLASPVMAQVGVLKTSTISVADQTVTVNLSGIQSVGIDVDNSGTYTLVFEASMDGGQTYATVGTVDNADYTNDTGTTGPGNWSFANLGWSHFRVRASAYTSGTPVVRLVRGYGGVTAPLSAGSVSGSNSAAGATGSAVPAQAGYTGINIGGTHRGWTGFSVGSQFAAGVAIVDGSGNQITSFGGGTQYTHDAAITPGSTIGTMAVGRASAAAPTDVSADNDAVLPWYLRSGAQAVQPTFAGVLATTGNGASGTGVQRVTLASDSTGQVTANAGTNLNTSALLTTTAHDAAFGTAGTADSQVRTVQGVAGMTPIQIGDNSASITVDNAGTFAVQAAQSGTWNITNVSGTVSLPTGAATSANQSTEITALQLIDNIPITIGSTTSGQSGALAMGAVTTSAPTYTTAQSHPLSLDTTGALRVAITSGAGSGGTALADDADFTAGTTSFTPFGGFYQSSVTACTDGDTCAAGITSGRAVKVHLTDAAGASLSVAGDVVEDAAETAGGSGPMVLSVRRDTAASSAGATGDNATFNTDSLGRLWVRPGNPCEDHARIQTAAISNSTSGNVEVVALNGSDLIYVCGYSLIAGAATGVRFVYGTGTACATGETGLTGAWAFAANGGIQQTNAGAPQFVVPAGNAFCTENTGANAIAGHVTYVRTAAP